MASTRQIRRLATLSAEIDTGRPNTARMYDYYLGGSANFAVDREAADEGAAAFPDIRLGVWASRAFLTRTVRYLAKQGIDQFLDLGAGIPTIGMVHTLAREYHPRPRVAYVDFEAVAAAHARRSIADDPLISIVQADIRRPSSVLNSHGVAELIDFTRPVALLASGTLHFIEDRDEPRNILDAFRSACCAGSYLVVSQGAQVTLTDEQIRSFQAAYARARTPVTFRGWDQIREFFTGYELLPPGLVLVPQWAPETELNDTEAARCNMYGGVGILR